MGNYYDGTKLLSLTDINGEKPELYICTSNRTGGKTTYFNRLVINKFLKKKQKFGLLYRFGYELDGCAEAFFKDIRNLFFKDSYLMSIPRKKGIYHDLFLNDIHCGYAICLNYADQIKKISHFFSDISHIIFDEFQSETNKYCPKEIEKFISIHTSIARGNGEMVRYLPVYMISNPITLINPYYIELDISHRLNSHTKFLRGDGFVLEQGFVKEASEAQQGSGFNKAFSKNKYVAYSSQGIYLNDNKAFIEKMTGKNRYLMTLKFEGRNYGVREYPEYGFLYCNNVADMSCKNKITVTTDDHEINYVMLKKNSLLLADLRYYFEHGCFRFKDLKCKEVILKTLSY